MKKLLSILAFFAFVTVNAQITPFNIAELKGITTAVRDAYTPPAGTYPIIYNSTDNEHQKWNGSAWEAIGSGGSGGSADGNDFLTSVTNVGGVLTFVVSNQTNPTLDLNSLDNYTGAELQTKLDAYFGNTTWRTQDGTGTDSQTLSFTSPNLSVSGGNSVNLSALQDGTGTDDQNSAEVFLTAAVNGQTTVQASLEDHESRIDVLAGGGADGVVTNIELVGTTLVVDGTGGAETVDVDLSSLQDGTGTDSQTLSLAGTTLSISGGNSQNLSSLQDGTGTDDQTAAEVSYANATSGLTATNVQAALDEIEGRTDTNDAKVGITPTQASDITANNAKISYTDAAAVTANTAKVSADGSVGTHSDVTIGTAAGSTNTTLRVLADTNTDGTYTVVDWTPPTGGGGEANTASNLGAGEGLFTTKSGVNLPFKSLVAGTNVTLSSDANTVTINATGGGGTVDVVSNVNTNTILGRTTAGNGDSEELSAGQVRTLLNVENGATADQTDAEIKTAYEANADTNAFTDAEQSKLAGIESGATADQSAAEVSFTNVTSGLTATNVQAAIDEVEARVDANDAKVTNTDAQDLTLTGNTLAVSGDPNTNVDISTATAVAANTAKISYTDAAAVSANTAKVSADGSFATHSDFTKTTAVANTDGTQRILADINEDGTYVVTDWTPPSGGTDDQTGAEVPLTTTNFDGNLSATDTNVQTAMETLDELSLTGVASNTAGLTGASTVTNIVRGNKADIESWASDPARVAICEDCTEYEYIQVAASDLTTSITTGTSKAYFRMPYAATLSEVRVSLLTAGTTTGITVDINEAGVSVLSTKLTTDATEKTSTTATTAAVISDSALADDAEITIDFDGVPTGGQGVIITFKLIKL